MAYSHSPRTVTDGLVFYYDLANQLKSYKGEPTVNLLYSAGAYNLIDGANDIYGRCTRTDLGNGKYRFVNNGENSSTIRVYTNQGDLIDGQTYAVSVYFEDLIGGLSIDWCDVTVTGNNYSEASSGRLTGYAVRSSYASPYYFLDINLSTGGSVTLFNPQVEHKTHVTPFVAGTRSETQGLVDLTGSSTIDLTNVSFDSNAQITFDGTNDSLVVGNNSTLKNNNTSIEFIIKYLNTPNGDIIQFGVGSGTYAQYYYRAYSGNSYWNWYPAGVTGEGNITIPNSALPINTYHHIVMTGNDQGYVQFYINGVAQSGAVRSAVVQPANWTPADLTVGGFSWDGYSSSIIPYVKIYNRVLTAAEVAQNFNAVRARYAI